MLSLCEPVIDCSVQLLQCVVAAAEIAAVFPRRCFKPFFAICASSLALIELVLVKSTVVSD